MSGKARVLPHTLQNILNQIAASPFPIGRDQLREVSSVNGQKTRAIRALLRRGLIEQSLLGCLFLTRTGRRQIAGTLT